MQILQQWLAGLIGLGALYLVATDGKGLQSFFAGAQTFVSGTLKTATGQK